MNQNCVKRDADELEELDVDDEAISDKLESDEAFPKVEDDETDLG